MEYQMWHVESRLPFPEATWQSVHIPQDDDDPMTEADADRVIELYRRAMPQREYRKAFVWFDPERADEDIPF